ncbi:TonB-dependent receptor [Paludibacter sp. 221]|uniref:SusC/RagA family TonB-linked outer membrane protein n=1 Tax=Paludibacter sp. 221 TaxID=2302939 RepID=UPI001EF30BD0|nr:TonB-dependent receptor [Paludibacter sp. 221]
MSLLCTWTVYAQNTNQNVSRRTITGQVISSEDKLPVIGGNIWLKGTSVGTITDFDGNYSLTVEGVGGVLVFSYAGMVTQEIAIVNQRVINVTLDPDEKLLDEVVVVGYGQQRKESVVGAISTVDVENLKVPGSSNLSTALAGQLSGIVAMTRSGEPGRDGAANFYIRGVSSFKGNTNPLVLVDGIERELDLVDTEDIAQFSILKDASASAVYGVRGANGVILITTKKGSEGKPKINARGEYGLTSPTQMPKFLDSYQWGTFYNEMAKSEGKTQYTTDELEKYRDGSDPDLYPDVNWIDELYRNFASNQRVNLSVSGGSEIVRYYISGSFYNENSIFENAGDRYNYDSSIRYTKYNFRANIDFNITKSTVLNLNLANIYEKSFAPGRDKNDIWGYTFATSPNAFPIEYSDGTIAAPSSSTGYNPWNLLAHSGYREQFWNSSQALIGLNQDFGKLWKPLEGLTGNFKFSWDAFNTARQVRSKESTQYHAKYRDPDTGKLFYGDPIYKGNDSLGYEREAYDGGSMVTYMEASLTYNRLFAEKHRIGGLFLYNHKIKTLTLAGTQQKSLPYKNQGIAGRVTYAYKDKYLGEFNLGYNGSENFAPGHRFGFFPALALGWVVSNESWFEPVTKVVDMLKFKASYGIVGNDEIGTDIRWIYNPTIENSPYSWNYGSSAQSGGTGIRQGRIENRMVSWEEAKKANLGIEFSLFNSLRIQADYFYESRQGIFLQRAGLQNYVGLTTNPYVNIGETMNQGFDTNVEYNQKIGEVFLTGRVNFTYNKNKLLNNDEPDWEYKYQNTIGRPFGSGGSAQPLGLIALGLFESDEEIANSPQQMYGEYRVGDIKYQDVNGDGKVDTYDRVAIGYTNLPEITYGFGVTAEWKGIDVNVFFQGISHISFFTGGTSMRPFSSGNIERSAINADLWGNTWMSTNTPEENANAKYPRLSYGSGTGSSNNSQNSTWNLQNGSFMRLKNFELGYSLPKSVLKGSFINSLRVYAAGTNLLTFSKFKLWDPEKGNSDGSGYPPSRVITIGINANF